MLSRPKKHDPRHPVHKFGFSQAAHASRASFTIAKYPDNMQLLEPLNAASTSRNHLLHEKPDSPCPRKLMGGGTATGQNLNEMQELSIVLEINKGKLLQLYRVFKRDFWARPDSQEEVEGTQGAGNTRGERRVHRLSYLWELA